MKKYITAVGCAMLMLPILAMAQQPEYYIAHFKDNKPGAITYTFDDGIKDQADLAYPMLKNLGLHGTFFVIPSVISETDEQADAKKSGSAGGISWRKLRKIRDDGNEIASHSWSHPNLPKLDDEKLHAEIYRADTCIANHMGHAPITFAYPYNAFDDRVRTAVLKDHIYSRVYQQAFGNPRFTLEMANNWADKQIRTHAWGVALIHAVSTGFDAFTSPDILANHLAYAKQHENELWIDTFAHIAAYSAERDSSTVTIQKKGAHQLTCQVSNKLDPKLYDQPLTVVVKIAGVHSATASLDGKNIPVKIIGDEVMFDMVPGKKAAIIKWN